MKVISLLILFLLTKGTYAQDESLTGTKYQFAQYVFKNEYKRASFKRFSGKMQVKSNSILYDEKTLVLDDIHNPHLTIFTSGIFYPNIITGHKRSELKSSQAVALMTTIEKVFYNMTGTDSLTISGFEELSLINPNSRIKRFVFWVFTKGRANPTECYIELENLTANNKTPILNFIKNSKLTFFYRGTIII